MNGNSDIFGYFCLNTVKTRRQFGFCFAKKAVLRWVLRYGWWLLKVVLVGYQEENGETHEDEDVKENNKAAKKAPPKKKTKKEVKNIYS